MRAVPGTRGELRGVASPRYWDWVGASLATGRAQMARLCCRPAVSWESAEIAIVLAQPSRVVMSPGIGTATSRRTTDSAWVRAVFSWKYLIRSVPWPAPEVVVPELVLKVP